MCYTATEADCGAGVAGPTRPPAGSRAMATGNGAVEGRDPAILTAIGQIEKQFGKGSIMRLGDMAVRMQVEAIPTGSIALDLALGIGGVPRGRVVEIYGPESSGKTTLAQPHRRRVPRSAGGIAGYIDAEHAFDPAYAARLGVNVEELLVSQPDTGEQALEICETLVRSGAVDVVVDRTRSPRWCRRRRSTATWATAMSASRRG